MGPTKRIHLGWLQFVSLVFACAFGGLIAYLYGTWWTFCGATVGVLLCKLVLPSGDYLLSRPSVRQGRERFAAWFYQKVEWVVVNSPLSGENVKSFTDSAALFSMLWRVLLEQNLKCANTMIVCGLFKSPLKYASWGVVGFIVHYLFHKGVPGSHPEMLEALGTIDPWIGLFFVLSSLQVSMRDKESEAQQECKDTIAAWMGKRLLEIDKIEGMRHFQSRLAIAKYRKEFRENSYRVGNFTVDGVRLIEGLFNMTVLLVVLGVIATLGAVLATLALGAMIIVRFIDLRVLKVAEDSLVIPRAERNAAVRLSEDPRAQGLLASVSKPGLFVSYLLGKEDYVRSIKDASKAPREQRQLVGRVVFFTLFAMSALRPVWLSMDGVIATRLAMLYFFSLMGLWGALYGTAERASRIVESLDDLPEVKEALELLLVSPVPPSTEGAKDNNGEYRSNELKFVGTRFNYPFRGRLLRVHDQITLGATVSVANVVAVFGPPRSGKSTLLGLIAGHILPDAIDAENHNSILIGGQSTAEVDMYQKVVLIEDELPDLEGFKVGEIFRAICGPEITDVEIRKVLREFDLLDEIEFEGDKFSGLNWLIGSKGRYLTEEQKRLLFLALNYAAIHGRLAANSGFNPAILALDGVSKLQTLERRLNVTKRFRALCDELHTTLVVVVRDQREIEDEFFVLGIVPSDELDPNFVQDGDNFIVVGGLHKNRRCSPNERKASQYLEYLKTTRELY